MANKNSQHVTPRPDGLWQVKRAGGQRATAVASTQREVIEVARRIAINQHTEVVIHGRDGRIREKNSYGNDPYPPKG